MTFLAFACLKYFLFFSYTLVMISHNIELYLGNHFPLKFEVTSQFPKLVAVFVFLSACC